MSEASAVLRRAAVWLWWWLRQVSGDAAYENYLRRAAGPRGAAQPGNAPLLSPEEFYLDTLRRRYTGITRCC
jgi:uncharacterized short protein YbdD (DUF466 family)